MQRVHITSVLPPALFSSSLPPALFSSSLPPALFLFEINTFRASHPSSRHFNDAWHHMNFLLARSDLRWYDRIRTLMLHIHYMYTWISQQCVARDRRVRIHTVCSSAPSAPARSAPTRVMFALVLVTPQSSFGANHRSCCLTSHSSYWWQWKAVTLKGFFLSCGIFLYFALVGVLACVYVRGCRCSMCSKYERQHGTGSKAAGSWGPRPRNQRCAGGGRTLLQSVAVAVAVVVVW